jgi:ectoine hydroxylase-related dioxygenase (phytanoyl-CoA dioxygenase family)
MDGKVSVSADQIEFFHTNGYLVLHDVVDQGEVAWMREAYDRIFTARAGRESGDQFDLAGTDEDESEAKLPQILSPSKYAPELLTAKFRSRILEIAHALLGEDAELGGDHAIMKPALVGAETPWHQDEAYWDPAFDYRSFSAWIPLQEATLVNGCMWFVPGSHKLEVLQHHSIGHDPRVHGLEVEGADTSAAVACPIPAGSATFHLSRTLHYTGPNQSSGPRRAYILGAGTRATPRNDDRRFPWNEEKRTAREMRAKSQNMTEEI